MGQEVKGSKEGKAMSLVSFLKTFCELSYKRVVTKGVDRM